MNFKKSVRGHELGSFLDEAAGRVQKRAQFMAEDRFFNMNAKKFLFLFEHGIFFADHFSCLCQTCP